MIVTVTIHAGAHYTDRSRARYKTVGHIDHIQEGARVKCLQLRPGKRTWVTVNDESNKAPVTHWNMCEGELSN